MWNALIRCHHMTSRKKIAKLRLAADHNQVAVLIRTGGCPGIMYVEGEQTGVEQWVHAVQRLRYKDHHLAARPAELDFSAETKSSLAGFEESRSVKDFAVQMENRGILEYWRKAMGFANRGAD